ncbi:MAG: M81 family metallopeptidase [Pirellulales bacterium]
MRVGIVGLLHESNTFISEQTQFADFHKDILLEGDDVRRELERAHHEIGGFFAGLEETDIEAVPIFAARAVPHGPVQKNSFIRLLELMFAQFDRAGPLDGLLVAAHGAMVAESFSDADGYWLTRVRDRRAQPRLPIIATLDPHGNLSRPMVEACDALISYRTNPHLDQRDRGIEAANLMAHTLQNKIRPRMAAAFPPLAINIERQGTGDPHLASLYEFADNMLRQPSVLSNSIMLGFPYADVEEMGSAAIVVTNDDADLAPQLASQLGEELWSRRDDFDGRLIGIADALEQAVRLPGPVCLLDMGDNVGGGSPADGTYLVHEIAERRVDRSFVCLCDGAASRWARQAGLGATLEIPVGGKTDGRHGLPLKGRFTVISLHDGQFREPEPRHGGMSNFDQGQTAIVKSEFGLTIMLTEHRMPPFSIRQLTSCGLDPSSFQILIAKGVHAPIAAYAPVCKHFIRVNTPGCTTADLGALAYKHRRRPLFPFERDVKPHSQ